MGTGIVNGDATNEHQPMPSQVTMDLNSTPVQALAAQLNLTVTPSEHPTRPAPPAIPPSTPTLLRSCLRQRSSPSQLNNDTRSPSPSSLSSSNSPSSSSPPSCVKHVTFSGRVDVRAFNRVQGGSLGVTRSGSYSLGLGWEVQYEEVRPIDVSIDTCVERIEEERRSRQNSQRTPSDRKEEEEEEEEEAIRLGYIAEETLLTDAEEDDMDMVEMSESDMAAPTMANGSPSPDAVSSVGASVPALSHSSSPYTPSSASAPSAAAPAPAPSSLSCISDESTHSSTSSSPSSPSIPPPSLSVYIPPPTPSSRCISVEAYQSQVLRMKKRYPSPNKAEELPRIAQQERIRIFKQYAGLPNAEESEAHETPASWGLSDAMCHPSEWDESSELDLIRSSRRSHFCLCRPPRGRLRAMLMDLDPDAIAALPPNQSNACCIDDRCPCVRDGVGCHVESDHYCACQGLFVERAEEDKVEEEDGENDEEEEEEEEDDDRPIPLVQAGCLNPSGRYQYDARAGNAHIFKYVYGSNPYDEDETADPSNRSRSGSLLSPPIRFGRSAERTFTGRARTFSAVDTFLSPMQIKQRATDRAPTSTSTSTSTAASGVVSVSNGDAHPQCDGPSSSSSSSLHIGTANSSTVSPLTSPPLQVALSTKPRTTFQPTLTTLTERHK